MTFHGKETTSNHRRTPKSEPQHKISARPSTSKDMAGQNPAVYGDVFTRDTLRCALSTLPQSPCHCLLLLYPPRFLRKSRDFSLSIVSLQTQYSVVPKHSFLSDLLILFPCPCYTHEPKPLPSLPADPNLSILTLYKWVEEANEMCPGVPHHPCRAEEALSGRSDGLGGNEGKVAAGHHQQRRKEVTWREV